MIALTAAVSPALGCGGFACDRLPVLQAAERVVFGIDREAGEVEMHVQITYTGDDDRFAWIVPVPAEPELFLTTAALFTAVAVPTQPTFTLNVVEEGDCHDQRRLGCGGTEFAFMGAIPTTTGSPNGQGIVVADERSVGPYDTVTLRARTGDDLLAWLDTEGYELPADLDAILPAYVADDSWFVALKLAKGEDTGDLAPLGLRYAADEAVIPVQLTAISATPDMRLEVYAFADGRAVPRSYLHVQVNEAAVNWWSGGANYPDVITRAANEAGGRAFATDAYGPSSLVPPMWDEQQFSEPDLRAATTPEAWLQLLADTFSSGNVLPPELFPVIEEQLDLAAGAGAAALQCACVPPGTALDVPAATDAVLERAIEPMRRAQALLDHHPKLTRMTSSIDAAEMTVDPVFVVNPDAVDEVSNVHTADLVYECGNGHRRDTASRRLELADGRSIPIPSEDWLDDEGTTEFRYLKDHGDLAAERIEQWDEAGPVEVLVDHTADLLDRAAVARGDAAGCGCVTGVGEGGSGVLVAALWAGRRRRSARRA